MRKLAGIIESPVAPPTNMIWLCRGELRYFSNGKWVLIGNNPVTVAADDTVAKEIESPDLYLEYVNQGGKLSPTEFVSELVTLIG